jgi:hypothetical protein
MDWGDERAQALQVGAVLLLGILVIALSLYQVTVVPDENREVEFDSYLDASTDLTDLRNDVLASGQRGVKSGTTVRTGTTYPARALFVNPPPATGRLESQPARNLTIEGAVAVSGETNAVADVWNGSPRNYSTRAVRFRPSYNQLDASPVVVDRGSVFRSTDNGPIPLAGQSLVDGNRLTLVTIGGEVSTGGLASTVTTEPVSQADRTVAVRGDGGGDIDVTLRFASAADAAAWNDSRVAEGYREQPRVVGTNHPAGESYVTLTLEGTDPDTGDVLTYELRISRVTVQEASEVRDVEEPEPEYVLPAAGNESDVQTGSSVTLTAEVRDRYNNPVTGTDVTFESSEGTFAATGNGTRTVTTTEDGRVSVRFTPNTTGTATATASFERATSFNATRFEVNVSTRVDGGGGGAGGTDDASSLIVLQSVQGYDGRDYVDYEFDNQGSSARKMTGIRLNFVTQFDKNGDIEEGPTEIVEVSLNGTTNTISTTEAGEPWFFAANGQSEPVLGTGSTETLRVTLDSTYDVNMNKEAVPISITVYYEGGLAGTYPVWLGA